MDFVDDFNKEYTTRKQVLSRRLDVTIGGFLRSRRAAEPGVNAELEKHIKNANWKNEGHEVGVWHLLAAKASLLDGVKDKVRILVISLAGKKNPETNL